jgi:hypothetical protein
MSRMFSTVGNEVRRLAERLATFSTDVRFFSRVDIGVFFHVALLVKPLATIFAGKRARVRMYQHVGGEGGRTFERFVALLAREQFFIGMHADMLLQAHAVSERLPAHLTLVGSSARMCSPHMNLQPVRRVEALAAFYALERRILCHLDRFGWKFESLSFLWHATKRRPL